MLIKLFWIGLFVYFVVRVYRSAVEEFRRRDVAANEAARREADRILQRDLDIQNEPFTYQCIGHPNRTLAMRYGIANLRREDGSRRVAPAETIRARKIKKLGPANYLALLPDFGDREVRIVVEPGSEFIKTFLPLDEAWFTKHADLETVLKDNKTFTLKDLAMLHVQKTVKNASN